MRRTIELPTKVAPQSHILLPNSQICKVDAADFSLQGLPVSVARRSAELGTNVFISPRSFGCGRATLKGATSSPTEEMMFGSVAKQFKGRILGRSANVRFQRRCFGMILQCGGTCSR